MSKKRTLIILGLVIAILPSAGLPSTLYRPAVTLLGIVVATLAFLLKRKEAKEAVPSASNTFAQNGSHSHAMDGVSKTQNPNQSGQNGSAA